MAFSSIFFWIFLWILIPVYHSAKTIGTRALLLFLGTFLFFAFKSQSLLFLAMSAFTYMIFMYTKKRDSSGIRWPLILFVAAPMIIYKLIIGQTNWIKEIPLGLSYITFALLAYLFDLRKNKSEKIDSGPLFVSSALFFPAISAGPIINIKSISEQILAKVTFHSANIKWGILLISNGLIKKNIADLLSYFAIPSTFSQEPALKNILRLLALGAQFYGDFSGYTDIAIGVALLFGIHLPQNFHLPFLSTNMADFWRRWHISLGIWIRTYVFFPILGKLLDQWTRNKAVLATSVATIISMLVIGMWHAVSWNYVVWALYNSILIFTTPTLDRFLSKKNKFSFIFLIPFNFFLMSFGFLFVFFNDLTQYARFTSQLVQVFNEPFSPWAYGLFTTLVLLAIFIPHLIDWQLMKRPKFFQHPLVWMLFVSMSLLFCIAVFGGKKPFIYIQF